MRRTLVLLGAVALVLGSASWMPGPADAAKEPARTKKGCIIGKEKWDAKEGKCAAAAPVKKAAKLA